MGSSFSSSAFIYRTFDVFTETLVFLGRGILGPIVLFKHVIKRYHSSRLLLVTVVTGVCLHYIFCTTKIVEPSIKKVVFITGCDSGLGFSLANHTCELGFTVLAGCLKCDSEGAQQLKVAFGKNIHIIELDITSLISVQTAVDRVEEILKSDASYELWAIINNAGVMVFGEFEWLTENIIQKQLEINLFGTFRITKACCPLLRKHKGRIINISSHCALATLPGLSVYGATKSGLAAWNDGLRVELGKYGINVIKFIPGSFAHLSNIMANQEASCLEMLNSFTDEQHEFYGEYFEQYSTYLKVLSGLKIVKKLEDPKLYQKFEKALLEIDPKSIYINESLKYTMYHLLFKYGPVSLRDYLMTKFMQMPDYRRHDARKEFV